MDRFSHIAERVAAKQVFDVARVEQFRKDFLMLMKNADRITDYNVAMKWKGYVNKWDNDFDDYIYKYLIHDLNNLKWNKTITENDFKYWDKRIREETWDFVTGFRVPIDYADAYYPEESRFAKFQSELPKWKASVMRRARIAWNVLDGFAQWYLQLAQKPMEVDIPIPRKIEMEGFAITVQGDDTIKNAPKYIEAFRAGLRKYKQRAAKVYPWLLQYQLPLVVDFKGEIGTGGVYYGTYIWLNGHEMSGTPEHIVHILAHEMSHHRYDTMGKENRNFWERMISGDMGDLDLRKVAAKYADDVWIFDNKKIQADDPLLYYQLMGLEYDRYGPPELKTASKVGDIKEYLAKGGDPVVQVHHHPISGYANKSPSEAFCEVLGFLVAYGPNRVPDVVLDWLRIILPSSHTASRR